MRGLICLLCLHAALAQRGGDLWSGLRAQNPPGAEFSVRLAGGGSYQEGELIRAEIHYPGPSAAAQGPPAELWQSNGFLLDPAAACGTLASPCFPFFPTGGIMSGPGPQSNSRIYTLNNFFRRLRPGRYRAAALTRKQVLNNRGATSSSYGYADPAQYVVSNTIEFEVIAASPA
jgi:hypothetical protein